MIKNHDTIKENIVYILIVHKYKLAYIQFHLSNRNHYIYRNPQSYIIKTVLIIFTVFCIYWTLPCSRDYYKIIINTIRLSLQIFRPNSAIGYTAKIYNVRNRHLIVITNERIHGMYSINRIQFTQVIFTEVFVCGHI